MFVCLIDFILNIPVNIFSFMSGRVFLGWTRIKQRIKCLTQGHYTAPPVRLEPATLRSWIKHSTTEPPCPLYIKWNNLKCIVLTLLVSFSENLICYLHLTANKLHVLHFRLHVLLALKSNSMNPNQTAHKRAVWSGFLLFAIKATKVHHQMTKQTTIVVNGWKHSLSLLQTRILNGLYKKNSRSTTSKF